ncbi:MAG TPA: sn-glycerol-1-phosphate dehydrogenase [Firmicutes bacterium]|nr:sn-glycerol-1-phosphate dehydrogenase [Bacillota bacterium]
MGRARETTIQRIVVERGAISQLPRLLQEIGTESPILLVADPNTWAAAGRRVAAVLVSAGFPVRECVLERAGCRSLVADEEALAAVAAAAREGARFLLAVGSGTINDVTRYVSWELDVPYAVVATAPSMDGYASTVAALTIKGCKRTFTAVPPVAIVGDVDVLEAAPREMILAGLGDILGKYTSLADWKVSSLVTGESYSEEVADLVRDALQECVHLAESTASSGEDTGIENAAGSIMRALVTSGLAMLQWGNSRPASGAEHHLAHYWEMMFAQRGKEGPLHGAMVGVATSLVAELYHKLFTMTREEAGQAVSQARPETSDRYADRVRQAYEGLADEILGDIGGTYLDACNRVARQKRALENWDELREWVRANVPLPGQVRSLLARLGAPEEPRKLGISNEMVSRGIRNAKEVRKRYTVFRLAEDLLGVGFYQLVL